MIFLKKYMFILKEIFDFKISTCHISSIQKQDKYSYKLKT